MISNNAINHLASLDHLKNLKSFLWKHGGGMDRVDSFRVSEADLAKVYSLKRFFFCRFMVSYCLLNTFPWYFKTKAASWRSLGVVFPS